MSDDTKAGESLFPGTDDPLDAGDTKIVWDKKSFDNLYVGKIDGDMVCWVNRWGLGAVLDCREEVEYDDRAWVTGRSVDECINMCKAYWRGMDITDPPNYETVIKGKRQDRVDVPVETPPPDRYETLRRVLDEALRQASQGKGSERHDPIGDAFEDQEIIAIGDHLGSNHFQLGQARKKLTESAGLPYARARTEILGAINYLAGAVIVLDRINSRSVIDEELPESD